MNTIQSEIWVYRKLAGGFPFQKDLMLVEGKDGTWRLAEIYYTHRDFDKVEFTFDHKAEAMEHRDELHTTNLNLGWELVERAYE